MSRIFELGYDCVNGYHISGLSQASRQHWLHNCHISKQAKRLSRIFEIRLFQQAVEKILER